MHGGFLHLTKLLENQREGVQLAYTDFAGSLKVMDASTVVKLGLRKIALDITTDKVEGGLVISEV
jgi:hypothetical protein